MGQFATTMREAQMSFESFKRLLEDKLIDAFDLPVATYVPMAHPDWKFGDVVKHPDAGPDIMIIGRIGEAYRGIALDCNLAYTIPVDIAHQWELVPEPDD